MTQLDELMTVGEVAEFLRTTKQGVYAMIHRGAAPPSLRVGKQRLFPRSGVSEWLAERMK